MGGYTIPYVPRERYDYGDSNIGRLLAQRGEIAAEAARRSGQIWGGVAQQIGGIASGALQQYGEEREKKKQAEAISKQDGAFMSLLDQSKGMPDPKDVMRIYGPQKGATIAQGILAFHTMGQKKGEEALALVPKLTAGMDSMPESMRGMLWPSVRQKAIEAGLVGENDLSPEYSAEQYQAISSFGKSFAGGKPPEGFTLGQGQTRYDANGKVIAAAPTVEPKAPEPRVVGRSLVSPDGRVIYRDPETADKEPLVAIIGEDGQPVYVQRSQALGRRPASNREQGRPVTSGDAGRLAELQTSMDDLNVLTQQLGTTGAGSRIGAALPNAVTELTGWGADSKSRQATIDRVKQVIGKALEGGVLRKEDEAKYEKILPTIGDPPPVAKAKLDGLRAALLQRRQRLVESLADAGYDTGKYNQAPAEKKRNPFR